MNFCIWTNCQVHYSQSRSDTINQQIKDNQHILELLWKLDHPQHDSALVVAKFRPPAPRPSCTAVRSRSAGSWWGTVQPIFSSRTHWSTGLKCTVSQSSIKARRSWWMLAHLKGHQVSPSPQTSRRASRGHGELDLHFCDHRTVTNYYHFCTEGPHCHQMYAALLLLFSW